MKLRILLIIALISFFDAEADSAQKTVSLATTEWTPYVGKDVKNHGFVSEIIAEAFKRVGYGVNYGFMPPKRVLMEVKSGEYDAGYPAYHSDDRARRFYYSAPIAEGVLGFFKRKDTQIDYKNLHDLAPYKIGVCLGFAYPAEFEAAHYLNKEAAKNETLNLRKLIQRRIDLFITDRAAADAAINTDVPQGKDILEFMLPPLETRKLHLIFAKRKGSKQKLKDFNKGLQMIIQDGTVEDILKKHGISR